MFCRNFTKIGQKIYYFHQNIKKGKMAELFNFWQTVSKRPNGYLASWSILFSRFSCLTFVCACVRERYGGSEGAKYVWGWYISLFILKFILASPWIL
jgi:hypothetical protein